MSSRRAAALRTGLARGPVRVRVRGGCMEPLFGDGQAVLVVPARWPLPGDVVAIDAQAGVLAHRLLGYAPWRGRLCAVTRADNGHVVDTPRPVGDILGRVRVDVPVRARVAAVLDWLQLALPPSWRRWSRSGHVG